MLGQALAKAPDSIFRLVIQDHIESIGKANTITRGWGYDDDLVAQVLSDTSPKLSATFTAIDTHK